MPADSRPASPRTVKTRTRNTARSRDDTAHTGNPAEITEGAWHHARNMLPVLVWQNDANGESFKVPDLLDGDGATIYVRINNRHFKFDGGIHTSHSDCCRHMAQSKAYREQPTNRPARVSTWAEDRSL